MMVDDDLALSRSASSVNLQLQDPPPPQAATKTKRKDKGKGKEVETLQPRVKEEPKALSLHTPEPTNNLVSWLSLSAEQFFHTTFSSSTTRIIVPHVVSQAS
jgi:hypothetical protein